MGFLTDYLGSMLPAAGSVATFLTGNPIASVAGSSLGSYFTQQSSLSQSKDMANHNANLQKELFDYMNEYNSPLNIRKRLEEGGYNPALLYGSGMQGISTSMPSVSGNINRYQGIVHDPLQEAQLELLRSQKLNLDSERRYKDALSGKTTAETATEALRQSLLSTENEANKIALEIAKATKDSKISLSKAETIKMQNEANKVATEIDVLFSSIGLTNAQAAVAREKLFNLQLSNDIQGYRNQVEKDLGWIGQPGLQRIIDIGVDGLTSLVGIGKFVNSLPKKLPKGGYANIETGEYFNVK